MSLKNLAARSKAAMQRVDDAELSPTDTPKPARSPVSNAGAMMIMQPQITAAEKRAESAEAKLGKALSVTLDRLVSVPGRRRKLTEEQFAQLRANLATNPLIQPIVVKRVGDDKFEVISGDNRLAAYRELGRDEIDITISSTLESEHEASRAAFFANLLQPSLPDYEKYLGFKQEMMRTGHTQAELAQQAGISQTLMSGIFSFSMLPPLVAEVLSSTPSALSSFGATVFASALKSGKITDAAAVALLKSRVDNKTTESDMLRRLVKSSSAKPSKPTATRFTFREGRAAKCALIATANGLRIEFKNDFDREWIEAEVKQLLQSKYQLKA